MKIKLFVTCEIQYFELGIFSFNSYVYYLTRGFIASTRAFNLPTRAFGVTTCAFDLTTRAFRLLIRGFKLVTRVSLFHTKLVILEITMSLVSIKKSLYQCRPLYTRRVSSHRVLYLKLLSTYNICIIYLHVTKACLKVTIVMFFFAIRKIFQML